MELFYFQNKQRYDELSKPSYDKHFFDKTTQFEKSGSIDKFFISLEILNFYSLGN